MDLVSSDGESSKIAAPGRQFPPHTLHQLSRSLAHKMSRFALGESLLAIPAMCFISLVAPRSIPPLIPRDWRKADGAVIAWVLEALSRSGR